MLKKIRERTTYDKSKFKFDSLEKFKELIKNNHKSEMSMVSVMVEIKSEEDPLLEIIKKAGDSKKNYKKPDELDENEENPNTYSFNLYYNKDDSQCKMFKNGQSINLSSNELGIIYKSAKEVYKAYDYLDFPS